MVTEATTTIMNKQKRTGLLSLYHEIRDVEKVRRLIRVSPLLTELTRERIVEMLVSSGAILKGHFNLLSEKHSLMFLAFGRIARNNRYSEEISRAIADKFEGHNIDAIVSPITAGALLGSRVAGNLNVDIFYVDVNEDKGYPMSRFVGGYSIDPNDEQKGKRVLIVNDLTTTGEGLHTMVNLVSEANAVVAGIGLFASRYEGSMEELASDLGNLNAKDIQVLVDLDKEAFKCFDPPCPYPNCGDDDVPVANSWELNR